MFVQDGMKHLFKKISHMKSYILPFLCVFLLSYGCKSKQLNKKHISFPIEDTMFENRQSEYQTIKTKLYSIYQDSTTLVIFNGKKLSLGEIYSLKNKIDSTYKINIFKNKTELKKKKVHKKYKTLILIDKSS